MNPWLLIASVAIPEVVALVKAAPVQMVPKFEEIRSHVGSLARATLARAEASNNCIPNVVSFARVPPLASTNSHGMTKTKQMAAALEASAAAASVPFVIGSIAFNVGRSRLSNPEHTHRWTVFVRGAHNQDLTYAISRVIFVLHVSYPDYRRGEGPPLPLFGARRGRRRAAFSGRCAHTRAPPPPRSLPPTPQLPRAEVRAPPFQVSETGWGEFNVEVEIFLKDPAAAPIRLTLPLKLHGAEGVSAAAPTAAQMEKPVVSEAYDEIVFNKLPEDPAARAELLAGPVAHPPPYPYREFLGASFSPEPELLAVGAARKWLADRAEELEERLSKAKAAASALQHKHLVDLGL